MGPAPHSPIGLVIIPWSGDDRIGLNGASLLLAIIAQSPRRLHIDCEPHVARALPPRYAPEHEWTRRLHHDCRGRRPPGVARSGAGAPHGAPRSAGPPH